MRFTTPRDYLEFMREGPELERILARSGIHLVKFCFSVSRAEQRTRFLIRQIDPVRQWKLSPMDLASLDRWEDGTSCTASTTPPRISRSLRRPTRSSWVRPPACTRATRPPALRSRDCTPSDPLR